MTFDLEQLKSIVPKVEIYDKFIDGRYSGPTYWLFSYQKETGVMTVSWMVFKKIILDNDLIQYKPDWITRTYKYQGVAFKRLRYAMRTVKEWESLEKLNEMNHDFH